MYLNCPDCQRDIKSDDINIVKTVAKCSSCSSIFSFDEKLDLEFPVRPEVFLPKGMDILDLRNELELRVSWRDTLNSFLVFFAIFWNACVLPFAFFAIFSGNFFMLLPLSLHLSVGIGLIYYILGTILNTTIITVDSRHLRIEHTPLKMPFYPNQDIPVFDIDQIYVQKYVKSKTNGRPDYAFAVEAILKNKEHVRIVKGIQHPDQALYIEQEVERFLEISDRPVDKEWEG